MPVSKKNGLSSAVSGNVVPSDPNGIEADSSAASSIAPSRAFDLAADLRQKIVAGEYQVDQPLPSERDLMERFSVARATVREALRILGAQGLIDVRRGRRGGSFARAPSSASLSTSLDLFISGNKIRFLDLVAVREAIEPVAAAQAAIHRSEEDIKQLFDLTYACEQSLPDLDRFSEVNLDWHRAIVLSSKNPIFEAVMSSISSAMLVATAREEFDLNIRQVVVETHWQIFRAILSHDPEAARRRMSRHVIGYAEVLKLDKDQMPTGYAARKQRAPS